VLRGLQCCEGSSHTACQASICMAHAALLHEGKEVQRGCRSDTIDFKPAASAPPAEQTKASSSTPPSELPPALDIGL
jgi:hypothetical protein